MKTHTIKKILIITSVLTTFVLYLCASVSKLLPLLLTADVTVMLAVLELTLQSPTAVRVRCTQKIE